METQITLVSQIALKHTQQVLAHWSSCENCLHRPGRERVPKPSRDAHRLARLSRGH